MDLPDTNPKTRFGAAKPGIHAIPPVALLHLGRGMEDGEVKYGLTNWRENEVSASVYYDAAFRHFAAWWDGEECAPDSGVHHLGHVMACCAILLDAQHMDRLNDNRPSVPGPFSRMVKELTRALETEADPEPVPQVLPIRDRIEALVSQILAEDTGRETFGQIKKILWEFGATKVAEVAEESLEDFLRRLEWLHETTHPDDFLEADQAEKVAALVEPLDDLDDEPVKAGGLTPIIQWDVGPCTLQRATSHFLKSGITGRRLAQFAEAQRHLGYAPSQYDDLTRTRFAFYLDAWSCGLSASVHELDKIVDAAMKEE